MATDDKINKYLKFFKNFAKTVDLNDQLPVNIRNYKFLNSEVIGGIISWSLQYLNQTKCPVPLICPLIKLTIDEVRLVCKKQPLDCGFNAVTEVYEPLKLMQVVISKLNEICLRYQDENLLRSLPIQKIRPLIYSCAAKNFRRTMEDRHVIIHDLNMIFGKEDSRVIKYLAIFDGHGGQYAAVYSASHLHQYLVESEYYPTDLKSALREAFLRTNECFQKKKISSGTTALCVLLCPEEKMLYVAWAGDSQAYLLKEGAKYVELVNPHRINRKDEVDRIYAANGFISSGRVNGLLTVTRAIEGSRLQNIVIPEPEIITVPLTDEDDILIMGSDGFSDTAFMQSITYDIYDDVLKYYNETKDSHTITNKFAQYLVDSVRDSLDNVTVIVVLLKHLSQMHAVTRPNIMESLGIRLDQNKTFDLEDCEPETDIDTVMCSNLDPLIEGHNENKHEEILANQQIDSILNNKKELSTTDNTVLDGNCVADNVAESGDDSDDEWNYYKVDPKQKENNLSLEINLDTSDQSNLDAMSQLNPDAKEFVPVSPTRVTAATPPAIHNLDLDDFVISQSPRRPVNMDIDIPSPTEFQNDMKSRPSELFDNISDADVHEHQNGHQLSSQEIMQNLLNGKDVSEIEFHPSKPTPNNYISSDESKDNKENSPPSNEQTTESSLSPMRDENDFSTFVPTAQDPMSMSFYQDNDEDAHGLNTNPFDLNKVQMIPDNIEDFEEVSPKESSQLEEFVSGDAPICEVAESPEQNLLIESKSPVENEIFQNSSPVCNLSRSPEPEQIYKSESKSPIVDNFPILEPTKSPLAHSPVCEISKSLICDISSSPFCEITKESTDLPYSEEICVLSKSPVLDVNVGIDSTSPIGPLSPKSPMPELTGLVSPDITASIKDENISEEMNDNAKSPLEDGLKSPLEDEHKSSLEDEHKSPLEDEHKSPLEDELKSPIRSPPLEQEIDTISPSSPSSPVKLNSMPEITELNINKEEVDVQNLITEAIQDEIVEEKTVPNLEMQTETLVSFEETENYKPDNLFELKKNIEDNVCELKKNIEEDNICEIKKNIEEEITDIVNEATEVTNTAVDFVKDMVETVDNEFGILESKNENLQTEEFVSSAKSSENLNVSIVESEAPSEINAFLDRSIMPEVTSPLSPTRDEIEKFQTENPELWKCVYPLPPEHQTSVEIKCETIKPEFPIHTITSPSEESKTIDTPPPTPSAVTEEPELKQGSPEPQKIVEAVEKLEPKIITESKPPAKAAPKTTKPSTTAAKKPLPNKTTPTSPSKPLPFSKTTAAVKKTFSVSATSKTAATKPTTLKASTTITVKSTTPTAPSRVTASKTTPKTRTPATTPTSKPFEKKPLANGDNKSPITRQPLAKKTTSAAPPAKPAAPKLSPTKPTARPLTASSKPTTIPPKTTSTRPTTTGSMTSKPKPTNLSTATKTVTSTTTATTKTATMKLTVTAKTVTKTAPKPPLSATSRPRSIAPKPAAKGPDMEKQLKETTNKQLSAAKTINRSGNLSARTTTTTVKKTEAKAPVSRTTTSRTTTLTTTKSTAKKPEVTAVTKTKTAVSKPIVEQNGIVDVIQEITTVNVVNDDPQLLKDNSPVIMDNSQLPPMEIIAD